MELYSPKGGLLVALFLHLCQAQDLAPPSPHPESAPPSLVEVIDAVKAAFEQAVKISKDDAAREVFEQVVEELVPKQDVPEQSPATADGAEDFNGDVVSAVVHEHENGATEGTEGLTKLDALQEHAEKVLVPPETELVQSNEEVTKEEEEIGLDHKPLENLEEGLQTPHQESSHEAEDLTSVEETKIEPVESIKEPPRHGEEPEALAVAPGEESEGKGLVDPKDIGSNLFSVHVELPPDSATEGKSQEGKEAEEQAKDDQGKEEQKLVEILEEQNTLESGGTGETEVEEGEKVTDIKDRESKVQKWRFPDGKASKLPEPKKQMAESQPDQEQGVIKEVTTQGGALVQDSQEEGEHGGTAVVGGGEDAVERVEAQVDSETKRSEGESEAVEPMEEMEVLVKATQKLLHKTSRQKTSRQKTSHDPVEVILDMEGADMVKEVRGAAEPQEHAVAESNDVTQETNDMNGILTSRDPLLGPVEPNHTAKALPPFPTQSPEHADTVELVDEHADYTRPSSPEVWKIGALAAAFFLILQTGITVIYILKCKRKTSSGAGTDKACEEGNGGVENNMAKTETFVPAEEQNAVDDLPKYSKVQQESMAMKTIPTGSTVV